MTEIIFEITVFIVLIIAVLMFMIKTIKETQRDLE